jgi:hypothetical protein
MDDLFRKTINYFNTPGGVDDDFVGQIVEVGAIKLKILKKIAEGKKLEKNLQQIEIFHLRHQKNIELSYLFCVPLISLNYYRVETFEIELALKCKLSI